MAFMNRDQSRTKKQNFYGRRLPEKTMNMAEHTLGLFINFFIYNIF